MNTAIRIRDLHKSYSSGRTKQLVIQGLSAEISPGAVTFIVGPSGCGKSTLLALMSGLILPDAGAVVALGQDISRLPEAQREAFRARHVGFVFQQFNLFSSLTAIQQVALPLTFSGTDPGIAFVRAEAALADVDLAFKAGLVPSEMSGGEKQRVAIARALVKAPSLLFADEPTSALDAQNGQMIATLLRQIAVTKGCTVVVVTHDPRLLGQGDRILQLEDGRIIRETVQNPVVNEVSHG